jgi:crotonobetainyl-CoA:carnitine CoA-transferase CaiB-like acyl-CoA transferase
LSTLRELFRGGSRERWVKILRDADIVAAPINTLLEASKDLDVLGNGYITELHYPEIDETLKVHGSPWHFSETPVKIGRAPKLGEHNQEVLEDLGFDNAEIRSLHERKVI